ncbi:MAG: hypothetical protein WC736_15110 [Gallionella sp.]|jgi:hypothetical protein
MNPFEVKPNTGGLFKNDKQQENWPDYKGNINVDGKDYWLSAWLKTSKAGEKYMSLSVQPKEKRAEKPAPKPAMTPALQEFVDDLDIPF